ncbi:MAG: ABC transporter permease [Planctomycetes bacterium]|nr:ABC transporter permease [Planctomycetota bacterium]MBI3847358.1 ABC transporter permease [Planctomycetota bacterium]
MLSGLARIAGFPAELYRYRGLISTLVRREIKGRYLQSAFGGIWAVVNPLFMLVVYTFVFSGIFHVEAPATAALKTEGQKTVAAALYIFCGMIPWMAFAEGLHRSTMIVMENANLIKKVAFPSEILPVYVVLYTVVNELIGLGLLVIATAILLHTVSPFLFMYPVLLAMRILFSFGISYFFAGFNVFVRDFGHVVGLVVTMWMFLTPIFYFREKIGEEWVRTVLGFNPMYHLINSYRDVFLNGRMPALDSLGIFLAFALVFFTVGYLFFMSSKHKFADEI